MDRQKIAKELVGLAKELTGGRTDDMMQKQVAVIRNLAQRIGLQVDMGDYDMAMKNVTKLDRALGGLKGNLKGALRTEPHEKPGKPRLNLPKKYR